MVTLKALSVAILWVIGHFPFANPTIANKITNFAKALPQLSAAQVPVMKQYIASMGLAEHNPWLDVMNECVDLLQDPETFNRSNFINSLGRASELVGPFPGEVQLLTQDYQTRSFIDNTLPK